MCAGARSAILGEYVYEEEVHELSSSPAEGACRPTGALFLNWFHGRADLCVDEMETSFSSGKTGSIRASPADKVGSSQRKRSSPSPASKSHVNRSPSPKKISVSRPSPMKRLFTSPDASSISPDRRRRSWRRSSMKGNNSRRSLPPVHLDSSGLSKSISLELPETRRLSQLLQTCFQFSVQKLEESLKHSDDFSTQAFKAKVSSITQELNHFTERLERDGTLHRCTEEPNSSIPNPALEDAKAQIKNYIERFSKECHSWDQILLAFQKTAMERSRLLEELRCNKFKEEHVIPQQTSQDKVLQSKPDYQKILRDQSEVFDHMEIVIDELQQAVSVLNSFMDDHSHYLKSISAQLEVHSFQQMENSPARGIIMVSKKTRL